MICEDEYDDVPIVPPDEERLWDAWYEALIHCYTIDWIMGREVGFWPMRPREVTR